VNITIEDKGKGIASDSLSQVFEPFYREDQADKDKQEAQV
jgi:signal transduction histidine kinase